MTTWHAFAIIIAPAQEAAVSRPHRTHAEERVFVLPRSATTNCIDNTHSLVD